MGKFISALLLPLPIIFILFLSGLFLIWLNKKRTGRILLLIAGCLFLIVSTRPVPYLLIGMLEKKYPVLNEIPAFDSSGQVYILVLAAGHADDESLPPNSQLSGGGLIRLTEGVRLHKKIPCSRLILSGPGGKEGYTQADALFRTALIMGLDSSSILLMNKAKNTAGEAREYKERFGTQHNLILVTSAIHMPRAMMTFRKEGINPVPAPTNFIIKHGSRKDPWRWMPSARYIEMMEGGVHEGMGILWLLLLGK